MGRDREEKPQAGSPSADETLGHAARRPTEKKVEFPPAIGGVGPGPRAHAVIYLQGRSFFVSLEEGREAVVGRSEEADVQLPTPTVSRRHFVLKWAGGRLSVQDCGSTNGTFVNGARLSGEVVLKGGDQITGGDALVVVGVASPQPQVQRLSPSDAFQDQLSQAILRASRLGRLLALLRVRFEGGSEEAAQGLARLLALLPGRPLVRALGPVDYHVAVEEAVESVRGACDQLAQTTGTVMHWGIAVFPRDGQDMAELVRRADAALAPVATEEAGLGGGPVAVDPASKRVFELVERIASSDGTVLLIGETGSGKEVVAQEIHRRSPRGAGPFVPVNCGAIPSTMFARELFGHERGAFTGAQDRRSGVFEAAAGGTLFLDEVGEIPLADQTHLLRAIETRVITRLGGTRPIPVDIRVISATNRDLGALVQEGRFRQDLLYRLDVLTIVVPALRDRPGDIAPLALRFAANSRRRGGRPTPAFSREALSALERYGWPGNVRELRNVVERLALLATGPDIGEAEVLDVLYGRALAGVDLSRDTDLNTLIEEVERTAIGRALRACGGNQTLAAERLGISRRTLIYRMQRYGIPGPRSSG